MRVAAVIPARLGSTRLHAKPLIKVGGVPLVRRVYDAARSCPSIDEVVVATDSREIADLVDGRAVMTSSDHASGTDRVAEAARALDADVILNIQGDLPFLTHQIIEDLLSGPVEPMATVAAPLDDPSDPATVKVVLDSLGRALYFSRSVIPHARGNATYLQHIGLYAFRRDFLETYASLPQTPLEVAESLEQLRVLEHGYPIHVSLTAVPMIEINTPADLATAEAYLEAL